MPIELAAILGAVSGISESIKAGKELINSIRGKKDEDNMLIAQTKAKIEEMTDRLEKVSVSGWSLNDYRELFEISSNLHSQANTLLSLIGSIPSQPSQDALRYISESIRGTYGNLKYGFKIGLSGLLEKAKYLDQNDQGMIRFSIDKLNQFFGGADEALEDSNYIKLKGHIRNISDASEDLVGIAKNKTDLITTTLIRLGK